MFNSASKMSALPSSKEDATRLVQAASMPHSRIASFGQMRGDVGSVEEWKSFQGSAELLADYPDLLDTDDLSSVLGCHKNTCRALLSTGEIPGLKIGRRWYTPKSALLDYLTRGCLL